MNTISAWISKMGQSMQFVAFWAHFGIAALIVENVPRSIQPLWMVIVICVLGAAKEFLYDAKYETDPPQTFTDNMEDWAGWVLGAIAGGLLK